MVQLHEKTLEWARERKLLENGNIQTQALKLGSEFGELCHDLAFNLPIKDDIGDCLVVCTILSYLQGYDLILDVMTLMPTQHRSPMVPTAGHYLGEIQDLAIKNGDFRGEMRNFINQLEGIALLRHTNLDEAWAIAYEDIKDRKGHLNEHGNFIKDES